MKKCAAQSPRKGKITVSLTGGEPLLYASFLRHFLPALKKRGAAVYLETNGTLPGSLKKVIRFIDAVSMDFKLPSACGEQWWETHGEFLRIAKHKAFVKVVLTGDTSMGEVRKAIKLIRGVSPGIPLVFQPVTPSARCRAATPLAIFECMQAARGKLKDVHVLPQMHKIWHVR